MTRIYLPFVLLGLFGYELVAGIAAALGIETFYLSVTMRATVSVMALSVVVGNWGAMFRSRDQIYAAAILFWALYSVRVAWDSTINPASLLFPSAYYWAWAWGACLVPMLATARLGWRVAESSTIFKWLYAFIVATLCLCVLNASSYQWTVEGNLEDTGRLMLTGLNPILLGHLGTTVAVLSAWLLNSGAYKLPAYWRVVVLALLALGIGVAIASNSRGPLVALFGCFLALIVMGQLKRKLIALAGLLIFVATFRWVAEFLEAEFGWVVYSRLFLQSQLTEINTLDRLFRMEQAASLFFESPIFGYGLELPAFLGYPHNVVLEAFMATGLVGGCALLVAIVGSLWRAALAYRHQPACGWIFLLLLQFVLASQFSGGIYTNTQAWLLIGLGIGLYAPAQKPLLSEGSLSRAR